VKSKDIATPNPWPINNPMNTSIIRIKSDISEVLPYLNTMLGGSTYTQDPPSITFKVHGKLITLHSRQIAINAMKDEEER
jgi:ArsR family metal-binding transcriptional regulator